jgi:transcriptional regulator with XRE-family HTH domain
MVQRIKAIKDALGISENELARRLGISQSTLNGYTLGKRKPSYDLAESVLNAFSDVSAEWLMRGEGPMYISDIPTDSDTDEVLDLKAEITRLRAERDELNREVIELRAINRYQEKRLDKLVGILHQEPTPQFSIVAETQHPEYITNSNLADL